MDGLPELEMMRDSLRALLAEIASPAAVAEWDKTDRIPRELMTKLGALGVCGLTLPERYGCLGLSILIQFVVVEELARRSCALASLTSSVQAMPG